MLVGRRGLSPVLIGRTAALAGLKALVFGDAAERDNLPAIGLIAGEAGVGKSRLLRELVGALPHGTQVLAAHAQPGSLGRPLDLVQSMLGRLPDASGDGRSIAVDEVVNRVRDRPSLVVFEDLHWADSDSVAVFESLAGLSLPALTLVATYRPEDLTSRLPGGEMLVRLERRRHVHQVHLDPLDRHEIAAFVMAVYGRHVRTGVIDSLHRRTGGNPFFLEEILSVAGDVAPEALADQPLPWSLAELVSRQLDGLSPDERRVVETAAVLGARARFEVLSSLSRRSEDELITDLRSLVQRGLLLEEDDDRFSFRHELVRDAVEGQLLGRERRRLHEQALETLRQWRYTDIADLARHAAGAGRYEEMVELAREGVAHYLGLGSTYQALQLAVAALAESPDDPELLAGAARAAWLIGAHDEAWTHVLRLLEVTSGGDSEPRLAATALAARIAHERNDTERTWALTGELQTAVDRLPPSEERARSLAAIAQIHMLNHKPAKAVEWAEQAAAEAQAVGAKDVWAQAMVERGTSLTDLPDRRAEGLAALIDAIDEAERQEDWVLAARGLNNLANVAPNADRRGYVERMREAGRRAGFDHLSAANYFVRMADIAAAEGDLEAALRYAERAGDYVGAKTRTWSMQSRAALLIQANLLDEAAELVAALPPDPHERPDDPYPPSRRVLLAARLGDREQAAAEFGKIQGPQHCSKEYLAVDFITVVEAALGAGVPEGDVVEAAHGWGFIEAFPHLGPVYDAFVAGATARHDDVIRILDDHIDEIAAPLRVPDQAALHLYLARALAAHSRLSDAREHATTARVLLDRWPGWRRDDVDALLVRLDGAAVGTDSDSTLTKRELEVAALLAEGLSNADVALRLFISPKTAAVHVSNILTKLGMANRAEVAAWAVRQGV